MKGRPFTEDESKTLRRLARTHTVAQIAETMGRTYASVQWAKHRMGIHRSFKQINPLHPVTLSKVELAYVAGLIDGEGTVSIRRMAGKKIKPHFRIANTSVTLMDWLSRVLNGPSTYIARSKTSAGVPMHQYTVQGLSNLPLYEALLPYLVIKRPQMELVIEFSRLRLEQGWTDPLNERQLKLISDIRALNIKPLHRWNAAKS